MSNQSTRFDQAPQDTDIQLGQREDGSIYAISEESDEPISPPVARLEPTPLPLEEAVAAVAARRAKVPLGLDNHIENQKDGMFDRLVDAVRAGQSLPLHEQVRLVGFGLRDGLLDPVELEPDVLQAAWSQSRSLEYDG